MGKLTNSIYLPNAVKSISIALILFLTFIFECNSKKDKNTMLFYNGNILTLTDVNMPEAILVQDGKIIGVGNMSSLLTRTSNELEMIDLKGKTLLPGFIATHTHPDLSAYLFSFVDLSGFKHSDPKEVWAELKTAVANAKEGQWIFCKGFDPILVPGLKSPHIDQLDAIAPKNPVVILAQSMHSAWANSKAFEEVGITAKTPRPSESSYFEIDAKGNLTGFISEVEAMNPFTSKALGQIDYKKNMVGVLNEYASHGITSIATAGLFGENDRPLTLLRYLSSENPSLFLKSLGLIGALPKRENFVRNFVYLKADSPFPIPEAPERTDPKFQIIGIKLWYDGSPYTGSMYLYEPYLASQLMQEGLGIQRGTYGNSVISRDIFKERLKTYHKKGFQLAIHSQGDRATQEVTDDIAKTLNEFPRQDHRHRLEHCLLLPISLTEDIRKLGITLSFHINHLYYYGDALRDEILGPNRANIMLPIRSAEKSGIRFTLHADQPMYSEDPLSLMETSISRKTRNGNSLGFNEHINRISALKALTIEAAWQLGMEKQMGSIEPGKFADLIILSENPLENKVDDLRKIKILATYIGGKLAFERNHSPNLDLNQ